MTAHDDRTINVPTLFDLTGKTALVTGGSRGIGRMIAEGYLQAGATVYISSRKAEVCDRVAAELSEVGTCHALPPADIAQDDDRADLVAALRARTDRLDILVNNAGTTWGATYAGFPESGFRKVLELNVTALFFLTRDLTPLLTQAASPNDPARVINIGSMDGMKVPTVLRTTFPYSASKAAVHHLTKALALELAPRHITVNAVAPGFFESKMTAKSLERFRADIERNCPLHRIGQPEEIVGVAIYLGSRAGAYTTGAVIPVDGGTNVT